MNCNAIRSRLVDLTYDELPLVTAVEVREHLQHCVECRTRFDALEDSRKLLMSLPEPTAQVDSRLILLLGQEQERQLRRRRVSISSLAACAAVIAVLAVVGVRVEVQRDRLSIAWGPKSVHNAIVSADPIVAVEPLPATAYGQLRRQSLVDIAEWVDPLASAGTLPANQPTVSYFQLRRELNDL